MAEIVVKLVNGELAGKTAQSIAKEVTAATLAYKKATIGTQEWVDANKKLEDVKELQVDLKKQIEGTASASDMLKKAFNNIPGAQYFNQIGDSFGMMKKGVGGLVSQFGVLKTAVAATGLGLILIVVAALVNVFKTFTPVIDKVEKILGGISAVVNELVQRFQNFGAGLLKIITGAPGGVDQLSKSFDGLGESIKNAYDAGVQLAELQQDLDDRNRGIAISNAEAEASIDKLITQSKNRTQAEKERLELLDKAEKVAVSNFEKENQLLLDNYKLSIEQAKQKSKLSEDEILQLAAGTLSQEIEYEKRGTLDEDLLQTIADNRVKVIGLEGKNNVLLEKINNQRDKLNEAREEKERKAAEARAKRREKELADYKRLLELEAAAANNIAELKVSLMKAGIDKEIAQISLSYAEKMQAVQGNEEQIIEQLKLLEEKKQQEIQAITNKYADAAAAKRKADYDKLNADSQQWADEQIALAQQKADFENQLAAQKLDTERNVVSGIGELAALGIKNEKAARKVKKLFALADIGIGLQQELTANGVAAAANPLNAVTFGAAGAAQLAATNIASIIRAGLSTVKVLAFNRGGYTGPGDVMQPAGIVHAGEVVWSQKDVAAFGGVAAVESIRPTAPIRGYASGGPVSFVDKTRGPVPRNHNTNQSNQSGPVEIDWKPLASIMQSTVANIKVQNVVTETEDALKTKNNIIERANV